MDFFDIIAIIGLIQALVVAVLIFTDDLFKNRANRHFAYFLILLSLVGLDARLSGYYEQLGSFWSLFFDIVGDDIPWVMIVYLPLFRFFLSTSPGTKFNIPFWLLYLPFFLFVLINGIIDVEMETDLRLIPFLTTNREVFYLLEDFIAGSLFMALHLFVFFRIVRKSQNRWIYRLWWYVSLMLLVWLILVIDIAFFGDQFYRGIEIALWSLVTAFTYWLMYSGLFQFNLANNRKAIREKIAVSAEDKPTTKPKLSSRSQAYYEQLMEIMSVDKVYRNPELGREDVAGQLGISASYLTQLLKEYSDKNLTSFINEFRVEEVKKMLLDPTFDNFDHLSIGLEAGFKSKSSYYTTFNGKTPGQFKKES